MKAKIGFLIVSAVVVLIALSAAVSAVYATPNEEKPNHKDGCHGAHYEECRDDPNPDKGRDCERSDDHICSPTEQATKTPKPTKTPAPTATCTGTLCNDQVIVHITPQPTVEQFKSPQHATPMSVPAPTSPPIQQPQAPAPASVRQVAPSRLPTTGSGGYLPSE